MKLKQRETGRTGVMRACEELLTAEGIWWRRWNVGAVKIGSRFFRFGQKGDADILAAPNIIVQLEDANLRAHVPVPHFLWIETKGSDGRLTEEQKAFADDVRKRGHHWLLVNNPKQLQDWLAENRAR